MPKKSEREQFLFELELLIVGAFQDEWDAEQVGVPGFVVSDHSDDQDSYLDFLLEAYCAAINSRFLFPKTIRPKSRQWALEHFSTLHDEDMRQVTRMSFTAFEKLLQLIEHDPIFSNDSTCPQLNVDWQLGCALFRLGHYGNGACLLAQKLLWGVGKGTLVLFTERVVQAILSLQKRFVIWPDARQRRQISRRMAAEGFPGCMGFVDGTTFPLSQKPSIDGQVFHDRKSR